MIIERTKIAFFSKGDNKFIGEIIKALSITFDTRLVTVSVPQKFTLIEQWMEWADICWFEWCDDVTVYASRLDVAKKRKVICRLHSYEAFTVYPGQVNWNCVDRLIFVSEEIRKYVTEKFNINKDIQVVIPNGVNVSKWNFCERNKGFKVAYVGFINYKKGPLLLLQTFKAIYDLDNRYQFFIAGEYQDPRYSLYFKQMVAEFGLENNFFFEGWQENLDKWLEDKNYILCTSVLESQNMSVMQAMAKGIKPVIHNFAGAKGIYDEKYLWNTISEAVGMVTNEDYDSKGYRDFISANYSFEKQFAAINHLVDELINNGKDRALADYFRNRMNAFIPYDITEIEKYDFSTARLMIGKREKAAYGFELIEFIINNNSNEKLIVNNIWLNLADDRIIIPECFQNSSKAGYIKNLTEDILKLDINYKNNVAGFIFDKSMEEDIEKNYLAYIWERGIPASKFLPISVYLRIIERYTFAAGFINQTDTVLEAPCGFGYGAAYLSQLCRKVEALDIAQDNITFCKEAFRHKNIYWHKGDVTNLPYKDNEFDVYVSYEVFEHLPIDTAINHIEEAKRVLKKSGKFIISTPNKAMRKNVKNPFHTKEYEYDEFRNIICKVFNSVDFYSMNGFQVEKGMKSTATNFIAVCEK